MSSGSGDSSNPPPKVSVKNLLSKFEQNASLHNGTSNSPPVAGTIARQPSSSSTSFAPLKPAKPPKPLYLNQRVRSVTVTTSPLTSTTSAGSPSLPTNNTVSSYNHADSYDRGAAGSTSVRSSNLDGPISSLLQIPSPTGGGLRGNIHSISTPNLNTFNGQSDDGDVGYTYESTRHNDPKIPQSVAASPTTQEKVAKINLIKKEIFETEVSYYCDLLVLNDFYAQRLRNQEEIIPNPEWKLLFNGLHGVITTCYALVCSMMRGRVVDPVLDSYAYTKINPNSCFMNESLDFAIVFDAHIKSIESSYTKYCKNNEAALLKVVEYTNHPETYPNLKHFLNTTRMEMQGKTNAWDLASLLVKPFQRVLKYPLLFKRLAGALEGMDGADGVGETAKALERLAEGINLVKKRKDVVEKYVQGKQTVNVMHGISKKWNRSTQMIKNVTGTNEVPTHSDDFFDALLKHFEAVQVNLLPHLDRCLATWTREIADMVERYIVFLKGLEAVYLEGVGRSGLRLGGRGGGTALPTESWEEVKGYRKIWEGISTTLLKDINGRVKSLQKVLATLADMMRGPTQLIKKRASKKLDHDRVSALQAKSEKVEKPDRDSAEEYMDIHVQLCEDLPAFFAEVGEIVRIVANEFIQVQSLFYESVSIAIRPVYSRFHVEGFHDEIGGYGRGEVGESERRIRGDYEAAMAVGRDAYQTAIQIGILEKWCGDVWSADGRWMGVDAAAASIAAGASRPGLGFLKAIGGAGSIVGRKESNQSIGQSTSSNGGAPRPVQDIGENVLIELDDSDANIVPRQQLGQDEPHNFGMTPLDPVQYLQPNHFRVRALYRFDAEMDEEVTIDPDDILTVDGNIERNGSTEWWWGVVNDAKSGVGLKQGWFPCSFVEIL